MSFKVPGNSRLTKAWFVTRGQEHLLQLASSPADGNNGAFLVRRRGGKRFFCIVSDGFGWEHVSVSLRRGDLSTFPRTPTWEETCLIKALFWDAEDTVVQYHPAEAEYVNYHPYTLHLWRYAGGSFPTPAPEMIA